jgi:hypothetical protein
MQSRSDAMKCRLWFLPAITRFNAHEKTPQVLAFAHFTAFRVQGG